MAILRVLAQVPNAANTTWLLSNVVLLMNCSIYLHKNPNTKGLTQKTKSNSSQDNTLQCIQLVMQFKIVIRYNIHHYKTMFSFQSTTHINHFNYSINLHENTLIKNLRVPKLLNPTIHIIASTVHCTYA